MTKKIFFTLANGFRLGVFIGLLMSIIFSYFYSGSAYTPMPPDFLENFSNELMAYVISVLLWGAIGLIFSATNFIFTSTDWSITKMTVVHAFASYILFLPIAFYLNWVDFNRIGMLVFTGVYIVIYIVLWTISMIRAKKEINSINSRIH